MFKDLANNHLAKKTYLRIPNSCLTNQFNHTKINEPHNQESCCIGKRRHGLKDCLSFCGSWCAGVVA